MSLAGVTHDELMAMAYALPRLPMETGDLAHSLLVTLIVLGAINTVANVLRVYVRAVVTHMFGIDDLLALSGYVCYIVSTAYAILGCYYGFATRDADMPSPLYLVRGAQLLMWWQIPYVLSIPLIKSAIAVQIMRLSPSPWVRLPLWFVIGGSTFNALAGLVAALTHCRPVSASWTGLGTCGSNMPILALSYLFTGIAIIADFTCAGVPFFLIRGLNMNVRRKWSLVAILSVGIVASIFTVVRVPFFKHYLIPEDALYYQGYICLWSMLEEGIGLFAASLPSLRKLLGRFYGSTSGSNPNRAVPPPIRTRQNKAPVDPDSTLLNTLHPGTQHSHFSASVSVSQAQPKTAPITWSAPISPRVADRGGPWAQLDDEDAHSRHGILIQRDVHMQGSNARQASPAASTGSDSLRYK